MAAEHRALEPRFTGRWPRMATTHEDLKDTDTSACFFQSSFKSSAVDNAMLTSLVWNHFWMIPWQKSVPCWAGSVPASDRVVMKPSDQLPVTIIRWLTTQYLTLKHDPLRLLKTPLQTRFVLPGLFHASLIPRPTLATVLDWPRSAPGTAGASHHGDQTAAIWPQLSPTALPGETS